MRNSTRVTAADVAREAGVSVATVSYVLNQTPGQKISAATSKRVRDAAEHLGYVRNRAAQALARGDSGIAIIDMSVFPRSEKSDQGFQSLVSHLEASGLTILQTWWGPENWEHHLVKLARETSPSAVITATPVGEDARAGLLGAGVRTISSLLPAAEQLMMSLQLGSIEQIRHLAGKRHSHVLFAPETRPELQPLSALRHAACAHTGAEVGITVAPLALPTEMSGYPEAIAHGLREHPEASAIAAYNDDVALRCLSALQALGVSVPAEMAVIGVDNLPFTESTYPPLTSIEYEYALGKLDSQVIDSLVTGPGITGIPGTIDDAMTVSVVQRGST